MYSDYDIFIEIEPCRGGSNAAEVEISSQSKRWSSRISAGIGKINTEFFFMFSYFN